MNELVTVIAKVIDRVKACEQRLDQQEKQIAELMLAVSVKKPATRRKKKAEDVPVDVPAAPVDPFEVAPSDVLLP